MKYLAIVLLLLFTTCSQPNKNSESIRLQHARTLLKKIGFQPLPFSYDMAKQNPNVRHRVDRNSNDTLFFDDVNGSVGGVLPDTSRYFGFIYYKLGDSHYPYLVTVNKKGKIIDRQSIGIGACGGLTIDVDSCVDEVTISTNLELELRYKVIGTAEAQTSDSTVQTVKVCNTIVGRGQITEDGKIEIKKGDLKECE